MTITSSSFIQDILIFLRNDLRNFITDPISRTNSFIMTSYPTRDVKYPLITIKTTNIETRSLGMSSESHWATLNIEIRVWARNEKEKDGLTQEVIDRLRDIQYGTGGTNDEQIYGFRLLSAVPIEEEGEKTPKSMVMEYQYSAILT